jgi:PAS domain S-box-containing protein
VQGWYGTATDCHGLRTTGDLLEASVERQRIAVSAAGLGVFEWQPGSDAVLFENDRGRETFGLSADGATPRFSALLDGCVHPDDREAAAPILDRSGGQGGALEATFRIRRPSDGDLRWLELAARVERGPDGAATSVVGVVADVTDRRRAEEHRKILIRELNHRVKNTLAVVQGLARHSFRHERLQSPQVMAFEGRLLALSAAHDQLTREDWTGASLADVAGGALGERELSSGRIVLEGPPVDLTAQQAVAATMCLHELATNAVKYGALSTPAGRVRVAWAVDRPRERLRLVWRETGGPAVVPPRTRGFGTTLIERVLRAEFGATVTLDFQPDGLVCTVEAPFPEGRDGADAAAAGPLPAAAAG